MIYIDRARVKLFLITFCLLYFILALPSLLPLQPNEVKMTVRGRNDERSANASVAFIFNNNLVVALTTLIPFVGWAWICYIMFNTGLVVASYDNPMVCLWLNPFVYVELAIYSFVVVQSIRIFQLWRRRWTRFTDLDGKLVVRRTCGVYPEIIRVFAVTVIVVSLSLLLSAYAEIMYVQFLQSML